MSLESDLFDVLGALVSNRCYPGVAPASATLPRITYQHVGGASVDTLDVGRSGHRNARIQVNVWASTPAAALALARSAEDALMASATLAAVALGALVSDYEQDTNLHGCRQDFSVWF